MAYELDKSVLNFVQACYIMVAVFFIISFGYICWSK